MHISLRTLRVRGKEWYKVHPVIKKARMTWAAGGDPEGRLVIVHEGLDTYTA